MSIEWIIEGLKKPGKTRVGLAKALRRNPSMVTNLLNGSRQLKVSEIAPIAHYLEVPVPTPEQAGIDLKPRVQYLRLRGEVAAGVWSESGLEYEGASVPIPVDPRWPLDHTYLLRVRGTSINRRAQDGDYVVCLSAEAAPRKFQSGDWVIAERERNGLIETTVKRVGLEPNGDWSLNPDSDDPRFQEPIPLWADEEDMSETIRVCAFVLQFVKAGTSF